MRGLFFLGALAVLLLTSACAVMDLSHLQTAVPLGTNHWEAYIYKGIGMNLYPTQDFRDIYAEIAASDTMETLWDLASNETWIKWGKRTNADTSGLGFAIGVGPQTDVFARFYASGGSGAKLGLKHTLWSQDQSYVALMPVINYAGGSNRSFERVNDVVTLNANDNHRIMGIEMHGVYSYKAGDKIWFTLSPHMSRTKFTRKFNGRDYGPYYLNHSGIKANARLNLGHLYLMGEIGYEFVPNFEKDWVTIPNTAFSLGLKY